MRSLDQRNKVARMTIKEETQRHDGPLLRRHFASSELIARLSRERVLGLLLTQRSSERRRSDALALELVWDFADEMGHTVSIAERAGVRQERTTAPLCSELRRCGRLSGVA